MLTTQEQTQTVPMPVCQYEILAGGPSGPPVEYAMVGQKVYHKWTCITETGLHLRRLSIVSRKQFSLVHNPSFDAALSIESAS